jgi:SAM-dependent methyltransferase
MMLGKKNTGLLGLFSDILRASLDLAARIVFLQGRLVSWLFCRLMPILGVTWFDHRFDHLRGPSNWYWSERGVLGAQLICSGDTVLDLCCGDGLFSALFYSVKANHVDALDRDRRAIALAWRRYRKANVKFLVADVVADEFPRPDYSVALFFSAIEHFSAEAGSRVLQRIAASLAKTNSVLLGSTPIVATRGGHNFEHDNEFLSMEQLKCFLSSHFGSIELRCSPWPGGRVEGYFRFRVPILLDEQDLQKDLTNYQALLLSEPEDSRLHSAEARAWCCRDLLEESHITRRK